MVMLTSINIGIGDCTTPEAIPMLMTSHYYYVGILYRLRQEKSKETVREQWNNAARRRRQRADKRSLAPTKEVCCGNRRCHEQPGGKRAAGLCSLIRN